MARTESKSIQVHPHDEQQQIDLMQKFHWNLLNSQEIKNIDNRLERRGDSIYQVSNTEHYVKLVFSRDLDVQNLNETKRLEQEFFSLPYPNYPRPFGCSMGIGLAILFVSIFLAIVIMLDPILVSDAAIATGIVSAFVLALSASVGAYIAYFKLYYGPRKEEADKTMAQTHKREQELLAAVAQYD